MMALPRPRFGGLPWKLAAELAETEACGGASIDRAGVHGTGAARVSSGDGF